MMLTTVEVCYFLLVSFYGDTILTLIFVRNFKKSLLLYRSVRLRFMAPLLGIVMSCHA